VHNEFYEFYITHTKSFKPPTLFQWDAVDISRDLLGQNVLKIFELATRHNKRTTRTELERERFFVDGIILTYIEKYIPDSLTGGVLPTRWRRKPAGIHMERYYVTVIPCIFAFDVFEKSSLSFMLIRI